MAKKRANGEGSIRKRDNGTWEARITISGKPKSVYAKTQSEARKKLTEILLSIDNGVYLQDTEVTVEQWLVIWQREYLGNIKPSTRAKYARDIRLYILPAIGKVPLVDLRPHMIRSMYTKAVEKGLSQKTIALFHGTLHAALQQALVDEIIKQNVCDKVKPPILNKPKEEMHPLKDNQVQKFLKAIEGNKYRDLFFVALFTGMRQSELIGLSWDCIDFDRGTIHLYRQLYRDESGSGEFIFSTLKNKEERTIQPPSEVIETLKAIKRQQAVWRLKCGDCWKDTGLVFTQENGEHIYTRTVYNNFKKIVTSIGAEHVRFHDLRHTYATLALQNGIDVKTVSATLGHATVAFTLDKYGHVTAAMMQDSANKMQQYINSL